MIRRVFGLVLSVAALSSVARADVYQDRIRNCERADAVCVGLVLLDAIKAPPLPPSTVRQSGGFLEIQHDGEWRGVCDDSFDDLEGRVVCRELGLSYVSWRSVSGGSNFWLDDVACSGSESSISQCPSAGWGVHNCSAGENVQVTCQ